MAQVNLSSSSFKFLAQGAIIQEFQVAGHNLVLSFPNPEPYLKAPHFGETIGRVANRISKGLIENLNGRSYQLATNLFDRDHLHGGVVGWGHRTFSGPNRVTRNGRDAIQFIYKSPDNEEGYPGTVELRVWYITQETDEDTAALEVEYEVELVGDECEETVINLTNHSYFNLGTSQTIEGTVVSLATDRFLVINETQIPTGEIAAFDGVKADQPFTLGASHPAIDHCFVIDKDVENVPLDTRGRELRRLVTAYNPSSGITLEVSSSEPAFQFYTGDYVDVPASEYGPARSARCGLCVEPGRFINAVNMPQWRRQVVLPRGQYWGARTVYKAWKA